MTDIHLVAIIDAMRKVAAGYDYVPEEHRVQRKIERHEQRGHKAEKSRLIRKGKSQGRGAGAVLGAVAGGTIGAIVGGPRKPIEGVVGGIGLGAIGGAALGRWVGGHAGRDEARARQHAVGAIKNMNPDERKKYFKGVVKSQRHREMADIHGRSADAAESSASSARQREWRQMSRD